MLLNIKNEHVERLAAEAARRQGITKTEAVRRALEADLQRLTHSSAEERLASLVSFLERGVWPYIPPHELGTPLTKGEREAVLGYGESGA